MPPSTKLKQWKKTIDRSLASLGCYMEDPSTACLFLLLVYLDTLLGSLQLSGINCFGLTARNADAILYVQALELLLQCALFGSRFFSHWGYLFDCGIVTARFFPSVTSRQNLHVLSFLRVWRFVRVVQSFVAIEATNHNAARKEAREWKEKAALASKKSREEIEVLKEALEMAAAEVASRRGDDAGNISGVNIEVVEVIPSNATEWTGATPSDGHDLSRLKLKKKRSSIRMRIFCCIQIPMRHHSSRLNLGAPPPDLRALPSRSPLARGSRRLSLRGGRARAPPPVPRGRYPHALLHVHRQPAACDLSIAIRTGYQVPRLLHRGSTIYVEQLSFGGRRFFPRTNIVDLFAGTGRCMLRGPGRRERWHIPSSWKSRPPPFLH